MIFVDDGSRDNTPTIITKLNHENKNIKLIKFTRNFGKAAAISAGLRKSEGDIIITMDCDLQDDPKDIPKFVEKIRQGFDFVNGWKINKHKKYNFSAFVFSKIFNLMSSLLFGLKIHDFNCPFKAYTKEVAKNIYLYGEMHRYVPVIAKQYSSKITEIKVKNNPRRFGKTKYGSTRLLKGFMDLLSIAFLTTFTKSPLYLFGAIGFTSLFLGFCGGLYLTLKKFILKVPIMQEPLLLLSVLLMILGVQIISTGLLGELTINIESKKSEPYIIEKEVGFKK